MPISLSRFLPVLAAFSLVPSCGKSEQESPPAASEEAACASGDDCQKGGVNSVLRYTRKAKTTEATGEIEKISEAARKYYEESPASPKATAPGSASPPSPGTEWNALSTSDSGTSYYSYSYEDCPDGDCEEQTEPAGKEAPTKKAE